MPPDDRVENGAGKPSLVAQPLAGRRTRGRKNKFVGAYGSAGAPHLSFADVADDEFAEILVLKQACRGLREEDLPAFGGIAKLSAAEDRRAERTNPSLSGMHAYANGRTDAVRPIVGWDGSLGDCCAEDCLSRGCEARCDRVARYLYLASASLCEHLGHYSL